MGTYNGERHLSEQLDSIARQEHREWTLTVSDDGSSDGTLEILARYRKDWGPDRLKVIEGPCGGFCRNFLSLADLPAPDAGYFAWADQDDVWLPDKLRRALRLLSPLGQDMPALYCGRTAIVDDGGAKLGLSPLRSAPPPSFLNALVQSLAGANTMTFNIPARELIRAGKALRPVSHDWWAYQIVTGSGGQAVYDHRPMLRYRQHGGNLIGSNGSAAALLQRVKRAWTGGFREMNARNIEALEAMADRLTPENRERLKAFARLHQGQGRLQSLKAVWRSGLFRRSLFQQLSLYLGAFMRRV
jgi:glycosyltransferase involved in cell wall biosynthesis